MVFSNNLLMGAAGQSSGYDIEQSIRFNDGDSAHLSRTLGTASNRKIWTYSLWMKRCALGTRQMFFSVAAGGGAQGIIEFDQGDGGNGGMNKLVFNNETSGTTALNWELEKEFTDTAAWYHFVFVYDTTQSTANNRFKCYINGVQQTEGWDRNSTPGLNEEQAFNNALDHRIGEGHTAANYFDGYLSEIHFIDGTAKEASDFGEVSSSTGQWVPTTYGGSYGNNGFYLKGEDSSDLGNDSSGNGNDFTSSGLAAADQVKDSPTNNLPTFNPLSSGAGTLSDGNLQYVGTSGWTNTRLNLLVPDTGKWALRFKSASSYQQIIVGLCAPDSATTYGDLDANGVVQIRYNTLDGNFVTRVGGSLVADTGPPTVAAQTFFQLLFDMDNGKIGVAADEATSGTFADTSTYSILDLNGTSLSTARQPYAMVYSGTDSNAGAILDAGQSGWETTVTGFKNLSLANLDDPAIPDPSAHFQPTVYEGNGTAIGSGGKTVTQVEDSTFQPDFVWVKNMDTNGNEHDLYDAVRGTTKAIHSSATSAESTQSEGVTAFNSNGFTVGNRGEVNTSGDDHVAWQWKAGGSGSSNTNGSVTSTVSANTTAGFSICKFNPGGNVNITFGHGLGVAPRMVFVKNLEDATNWQVLNVDMGVGKKIFLNASTAPATDTNMWQNTAPTSTVVSVGTSQTTAEDNIAYCFADVEGYCKIGTYEGNGSTDGPFVYTGLKPRYLLVRRYDGAEGWNVIDTARGSGNFGSAAGTGGFNPTAGNDMNNKINLNDNNAQEDNPTGSRRCSFYSNGFKVRNTNTAMNASGGDYFYMAIAEAAFKHATAR